MRVRKQEAAAEWQEFATLAAALGHVKGEGAPSTLRQVQIERAAKNSKRRNSFEFSLKPPPLPRRNPHSPKPRPLPLQRNPLATSSKSYVRCIVAAAVANYVGRQAHAPNANGMFMSIVLSRRRARGTQTVGVLRVLVEVVQSLWVTLIPNSASNATAMCMLNVHLMVRVFTVLNPHACLDPPPPPLPRFVHSTLRGNPGAPC